MIDGCITRRRTLLPPGGALVEDGERTISPPAFQRECRRLAARIDEALSSVEGQAPVVCMFGKSIENLVAIGAVLETRHFYLPLDPEAPSDWLAKRLAFWTGGCLVCPDERVAARVAALAPGMKAITYRFGGENPGAGAGESAEPAMLGDCSVDYNECGADRPFANRAFLSGRPPESVAYLMFTSGSTGTPKAVPITWRSLDRFAQWVYEDRPPRDADGDAEARRERVAAISPPWFDLSVWDWTRMFVHGSTLVVVPDALVAFPSDFVSFLRDRRISSLCTVPSVLARLRSADEPPLPGGSGIGALPELSSLGFIGEVMPVPLLDHLAERMPTTAFSHYYGPTEATVMVSFLDCKSARCALASLPLGKPRPGVELLVVDERGNEVARDGGKGEIAIAGECLSPGYLGEARGEGDSPFVRLGGKPFYLTGDIGRRSGDEIFFVGRADGQFKRRGIRIEAGEIEAALLRCEGVEAASVEFVRATGRVVAHWCGPYPRCPGERLRAFLPKRLLPDEYRRHGEAEFNRNGKFDGKAWFEG